MAFGVTSRDEKVSSAPNDDVMGRSGLVGEDEYDGDVVAYIVSSSFVTSLSETDGCSRSMMTESLCLCAWSSWNSPGRVVCIFFMSSDK